MKGFPQHYDKNPHIISTNALLKNVAVETNVRFIDTWSFFCDENKKLKKEYTLEGLHINASGYETWVKFLKENHDL